MAGSSAFGSAPSPAQPLDYASRRGEVKSTPAGLMTWDGADWLPLVLPTPAPVTASVARKLSTFVTTSTVAQITSGNDTPIPYEDHSADTLGFYNGTNLTRFVCPAAADGLYMFMTSVWWANGPVGTGTTERSVWHRVTRASTDGHTSRYSSQNGLYPENRPALQTVVSLIGLAATDYVEALGFQTTGANLGFVNAGSNRTLVCRLSD